jgi:hypothetical protein
VPAGLDVGGVEVVLGVLDPSGTEGQLLVVFEELVASAVLAYEATVLGVTWCGLAPRSTIEGVSASAAIRSLRRTDVLFGGDEERLAKTQGKAGIRIVNVPTSGPSSPAHENVSIAPAG